MNLTDVMAGMAALIDGLTYPYPVETVTVPCSVVGYPTDIVYDNPGVRILLPVWRIVGGDGEEARDALSDALADQTSVKEALDGLHAWGDVRVTNATVDPILIGTITYPALRFDTEVLV